MTKLTDSLDRFNRKERNLLIRDALGHQPGKALALSDSFRKRIGAALNGLEVPEDAWWATDYHLNWIAGALALWRGGQQVIGAVQVNGQSEDPVRWLVERNQEDADLLIAFGTTMVLVEVKAFGYFTNKQIDSKILRWRLLKRYSELSGPKVTLHFMLMSRSKPIGLHQPPSDLLPGMGEWPHATLDVQAPLQKLKVTGKDPYAGKLPVDPKAWFVIPVSNKYDEDEVI